DAAIQGADGVLAELDTVPQQLARAELDVLHALLVLADERLRVARMTLLLHDLPLDVKGLVARRAAQHHVPGTGRSGGDRGHPLLPRPRVAPLSRGPGRAPPPVRDPPPTRGCF